MALRHFPGMTQDWLEAKLRAAYEAGGSGQRTVSGGAGDLTSSVIITESTAYLIKRLSHDLRILDPNSPLLNSTPIPTRTVPHFGYNNLL